MQSKLFYVYLDPRKSGKFKYCQYEFDHEPFYVGKGHHFDTGKKISKSKTGKTIALKGKPKSLEHRKHLSLSRIKMFRDNPELRKRQSIINKKSINKKGVKEKISKSLKAYFKKQKELKNGLN